VKARSDNKIFEAAKSLEERLQRIRESIEEAAAAAPK